MKKILGLVDLAFAPTSFQIHAGAVTVGLDPLTIDTPSACWAYAASHGFGPELLAGRPAGAALAIELKLCVTNGRLGVGCTNVAGDVFLVEQFVDAEPSSLVVTLIVADPQDLGRLILRNTENRGRPSRFALESVSACWVESSQPTYLVSVRRRDVAAEEAPDVPLGTIFGDEAARAINTARLDLLRELDLPIRGTRVLDAGCGVGHFTPFYTEALCRVVGVDGREENITEMCVRYPDVEGHVGDVQSMSLESLGRFDVVHCFGLLYHLESPIAALRNLSRVCDGFMVIETMVCDSSRPILVLADETKAASQALSGLGVRPSPAFLAMALNRIGFRHVYAVAREPSHPDFMFEWQDNLDVQRDGHNLRCIFVASRSSLNRPLLLPLLDQ